MAKVKAPVTKLNAWHHISYGAGDAGGVVTMVMIGYELGYTIMNIGMGSLLGVMATNDAERASLASARGFGSTVGGIIGMMVIPVVLQILGETPAGYAATGIAAAVTCGILIFIHYIGTVERNVEAQQAVKSAEEKEKEKVKVTDILQVFKVNRPYLALCVHSICICFVQGIAQGASSYMYADVLGAIGLSSIATAVGMPVMFGGLILAPILAKKYDFVKIIRVMILVGCLMLGVSQAGHPLGRHLQCHPVWQLFLSAPGFLQRGGYAREGLLLQ